MEVRKLRRTYCEISVDLERYGVRNRVIFKKGLTSYIPDLQRYISLAYYQYNEYQTPGFPWRLASRPLLRLKATVGTTSSLHCPDPTTFTKLVFPEAFHWGIEYGETGTEIASSGAHPYLQSDYGYFRGFAKEEPRKKRVESTK
jgi:hypothetical protein